MIRKKYPGHASIVPSDTSKASVVLGIIVGDDIDRVVDEETGEGWSVAEDVAERARERILDDKLGADVDQPGGHRGLGRTEEEEERDECENIHLATDCYECKPNRIV